jgi:rubrerythrin
MGKKPSYLGLLNAIAFAEGEAAEYLGAWAAVTPDPDVRRALRTVCAREAEHSAAFTKRLDELGYEVIPKPSTDHAKRLRFAKSTKTDLEKLSKFGFERDPSLPDVFDKMFANHDIDVTTGALLGRYIAEERDTARLLHGLCRKLHRRSSAAAASSTAA